MAAGDHSTTMFEPLCETARLVGAFGIMSVAVEDCDLVNVPVFFSGMIVFDFAENGPTPTPFIAATVK